MTVNEFRQVGLGSYECLRPYTEFIGKNIEDYTNMSEQKLAEKAYSAWCSGTR